MAPRSTLSRAVDGSPLTARDRKLNRDIAAHRERAGSREERRAAHHAMLEEVRQWMATPEGRATVARVSERLGDRYSELNLAAIAYQAPHALAVETYRGWKALGGQVQRGQSAIRITRKGGAPASVFDVSQTDLADAPDWRDAVAEAVEESAAQRSDDIPF